jgi:hypothetical protein
MNTMETRNKLPVAIVFCPDFSSELETTLEHMHAWIAETPANRRAVEAIWLTDKHCKSLIELTTFKSDAGDVRLGILQTVEDHHNEYTQVGPYDELVVFGLRLTQEVRAECEEFGFDLFEETDQGFKAIRSSNQASDATSEPAPGADSSAHQG